MFVRSHHFQQWDIHLADRLKHLIDQIEPDGWGVAHLVVNDAGLQEERFELEEAIVVFRDGALVCYPGNAGKASPASRGFQGKIQGAGAKLGVHLGVRALQRDAPNVAEPGQPSAAPTRFLVQRDDGGVNDVTTGANAQAIEFLEYDLRILFDGDDLQGFDAIKVAEVRRGAQQARPFVLSDEYAPPCLRLDSSQVLKRMAARVLQHAHRTVATMHQEKPQMFGGEAGSGSNLRKALLSQALHAYYPLLTANLEEGRCHPRRAFEMIASLAGAIAATWEDRHPHKQPRYEHLQPAVAFKAICDQVVEDLKRVYPASYEEIQLDRENDYHYTEAPAMIFERGARLYIAITTGRVGEQVVSDLKPLMKLGSRTRVQDLVRRKLAGVPVEPCPAPGEYPSRPEQVFYRMSPGGDEWRQIESEGTFGAYLPFGDPAGKASLIVIRQEGSK
jgi:type VI secretion system protein ImpJ